METSRSQMCLWEKHTKTLFSYLNDLVNHGNTIDTECLDFSQELTKGSHDIVVAKTANCWRLRSILLVAGWVTPSKSVIKRLKVTEGEISGGCFQVMPILRITWMSQKNSCFLDVKMAQIIHQVILSKAPTLRLNFLSCKMEMITIHI